MNLSPFPKLMFLDNNGQPLVGGLLFTYEAGTSNKIDTYTDASGGSLNTNPVELDFRGECNVWLDPTKTYKFVLSPKGDTDPPTRPIWSVDDIAVPLDGSVLTQNFLGQILFPRSADEIANNVFPVNYAYLWGVVQRYTSNIPASDSGYQGWFSYGDVPTQVDGDTITIPGDVTSRYLKFARLLLVGVAARINARIVSSTYVFPTTTIDLQFDLGGSLPANLAACAVQVLPRTDTQNVFSQNVNATVGDTILNRNDGTAAAGRLSVGAGEASGFVMAAVGQNYVGEYFPTSAVTGPCGVLYTTTTGDPLFVPRPIILVVADFPRVILDAEPGPAAAPVRFINATETISMHSPLSKGGIYQTWRRTNAKAGTRMGIFGFDSNDINNDLRLINEVTSGNIVIRASSGSTTISATNSVALAGGNYSIDLAGLGNFANDAAAAAGGVPVSGLYRNGSVLQIRVT